MASFTLFHLILLILFSLNGHVLSDDSGNPGDGDCEQYKDETCLKFYDNAGLMTYEDAENFCKQQSSHLSSTASQDKQDFIENILKTHNVFDYIWLGLKFVNGNYQWTDGSDLMFSNWAEGSPKNTSEECVQMTTDDLGFGKWSEVACMKKNAVLCEKNKVWTVDELQNAVMTLLKNPVPIGFIYVQLPKEKLPQEIWPTVVWTDVTSDYDGLFFRAEGKDSSSFGTIQEQSTPRIYAYPTFTIISNIINVTHFYGLPINPGAENIVRTDIWSYDGHTMALSLGMENTEVRPRNMAIRIWKRIQ